MSVINQLQLQWIASQNQLVQGKKGPLCGRINIDFSDATHYDLNLQQQQSTGNFDFCQSIFIDNSKGGDTVNVTFKNSGMVIVAKAGSQGWYNVVSPNPIEMSFDSNGGALCLILITNSAIPGAVWSTN